MKQILQDLKTGKIEVADVPLPVAQRGRVLVRTAASLISAGTERMAVEMGQKSLLGKARERPDLVKQVIQKAKNEGVVSTINAVRNRLDSVNGLGYSAAGAVLTVADDVLEFGADDRVACAGAGFASHAEVLSVPKNLCVRLAESVSFEAGAFGTLGAIALQGVRLAKPTLGESVVVIGLGLIGQLTAQLLRTNGCRVFGIDIDPERVVLARQLGTDDGCAPDNDTERRVREWTRGRGADAVLITAATSSNEPVQLAGQISRLKGRVVAVGLVGLDVPRKLYYEKELTLKISMSYGPGRYDPEYEEHGHDYPFAYVRWTEGRNIEAFLDLVATGRIDLKPLITHRFSIDEGEQAYQLIASQSTEKYLAVILNYDTERQLESRIQLRPVASAKASATAVRIGLIGAGNYAKTMLLPNFKAAGAEFHSIATASGISAREIGKKYGFLSCVSNADEVIDDQEVNLIVVATRHDTHASLAQRVLARGRSVFVEKPLALNNDELRDVMSAASSAPGQLMVGFNRRFSPLASAAKEFFQDRRAPLSISYRVNAGRIPRTHWIQNPDEGGGRIVGEVCHFIDLMQFLTGSVTTRVYAESIAGHNAEAPDEDSVFITLRFGDGSNGAIAYLAEGDRALAKERVEIFGEGKVFILDDFRSATTYHNGRKRTTNLRNQDKGQASEVRAVCAMITEGKPALIALEDLAATTRATFCIRESLRTGQPIEL
jgi:predicted dehydrogenase/threonine dehydrogenase-like Zn-dependent dehydrogenase